METQGRLRGDGVLAVAYVRDGIIAVTAGEGVVAVAALNGVIARTAGDGVIAVAGVDGVIARTAGDGVIAVAAGDHVVECRAGDGVITVAADDRLARASIGAVDGVITDRAGHRITDLCHAVADYAQNDWSGIRGHWDLAAGVSCGKVAVLLVRGEGIPIDRDHHIRILCRLRAVTDCHFVTLGGRFGCQRRTNGAGKCHAGHRNSGNRLSKYHWDLHAIASCVI